MRKKILLLIILLLPISLNAYSNKIIPGGENIGIMVKEKGVTIIGFYNNENNKLKIGDKIIKVNEDSINTIDDLVKKIKDNVLNNRVNITYIRGKEEYNTDLKLKYIDGVYKTGLYVKDNITGVGTLTYIDPETKIFGSLGHEILNNNTKDKINVDEGYIFKSSVTSIRKSVDGNPGGKNANFNQNIKYGNITKNTNVGIYGIYDNIPNKDLMDVGTIDDIKLDDAYILTTLKDNKIRDFKIRIMKINKNSVNKNLYFKITDNQLLKETGGIVQGMSGSPIIQNDKIIGAVTHVVIDNVNTGYGVFITSMLKEGEK